MKKFIFIFVFFFPLLSNANGEYVDKNIKIENNIATIDVLSIASNFNNKDNIRKNYTIGDNNLEVIINNDLGIVISCKPTNNNIAKGTVIREKESKRITTFHCGGHVDINKVDKPSANITILAYNSLYKYSVGSRITEEFVYRRANDNKDPNLNFKRYEKDNGEKDTLVSYKEIIMRIETSAIEKFK